MKFDRIPVKGTIFTEVFNSSDWTHFNTAYSIKNNPKARVPRYLDKTIAPSRQWVKDVIHVWARALPINFALAVQVIQTGDYKAIQRHYVRIRAELLRQKDELGGTVAWQEAYKTANHIAEWGDGDLAAWARSAWVDALTLEHPHVKRNEFSGRVTPGNNKKPDAAGATEVKSKRPRAKGKSAKKEVEAA